MRSLDKEVTHVLRNIMAFLVPEGMTTADRRFLAQKAGISPETLRTTLKRHSMNADTLIRLLLARGVSGRVLSDLPQQEISRLSEGEAAWLSLGRQLSEAERIEFAGLVRFIKSRWGLK